MPTKVKDKDKCKEWESRRRDRLNDAFKNLAQLLPHYDPAKIPAKIDILEKSTEFVKELRLSNSRLLSNQAENDEKCKLIKELQDEVNKLILRVKQLTLLLKKASITIPTGPEIKTLGSKRFKWSGKLKPEDVENSVIRNETLPGTKPSGAASCAKSDKEIVASTKPIEANTSATTSVPTSVQNAVTVTPSLGVNGKGFSTPSITIPLREINSSKATSDCPKPLQPTSSASLSPITTSCANVVSTVIATTSLISEPIFTTATTPLQLPLQTFILAPCPITSNIAPIAGHPSQILTRFTLPSSLLPKQLNGLGFPKIPIKPVLKAIPKVIKRRRKRSKKIVAPPFVTELEAKKDKIDSKNDDKVEEKNSNKQRTVEILNDSNKCKKDLTPGEVEAEKIVLRIPSPLPDVTVQSSETNATETDELSSGTNVAKEVLDDKSTPEITSIVESKPGASATVEDENHAKLGIDTPETLPEPDPIPVLRIIDSSKHSPQPSDSNVDNNTIFSNVVVEEDQQPVPQKPSEPTDNVRVVPVEGSVDMSQENVPLKIIEKKDIVKDAREMAAPTVEKNSSVGNPKETLSVSIPEDVQDDPAIVLSNTQIQSNQLQQIGDGVDIRKNEGKNCKIDTLPDVEVQPTQEIVMPHVTSESTSIAKESENLPETCVTLTDTSIASELTITPREILEIPIQTSDTQHQSIPPPSSSSINEESLTNPSFSAENNADGASNSAAKQAAIHRGILDTVESSDTPNDKISECIARSIDLIDANDSELMELGENWEDTGGSPKSPISPTQMFLNIFPLLPRESSISEQQPQPAIQQQSTIPQSQKNPVPFPSSSRSSFFIDAMLPEDSSGNNNVSSLHDSMEIMSSVSTPLTQCLALTPPQLPTSPAQQVSSSFANYYWNTGSLCNIDNSIDYRATSSSLATPRSSSMSTVTALNTQSHALTPSTLSSTNTSASTSNSTKTNGSESSRSKMTAKSSGASTNATKPFHLENFSFSKAKAPTTTTASTTASTSTNCTWSITSSSQPPLALQQQSQSTAAVQQVTGHTQHFHQTTSVPSSVNNQSHSTTSLLDSINAMDAALFRPLINALDDFRPLEFSSNNTLPAQPLPPLIPPAKSLQYTPQFNPTPQPLQNPMSVNYHTPLVSYDHHHNAAIQSSIIQHHQPQASACSTSISNPHSASGNLNLPTTSVPPATGTRKQQTMQHQSTPSTSAQISSRSNPYTQDASSASSTTSKNKTQSPQKTTKTSGKQGKSEPSSKQSRSGKSSRTQPYIVPTTTSAAQSSSTCSISNSKQDNTYPTSYHNAVPMQNQLSHSNPNQNQSALANIKTANTTSNNTSARNYNFPVSNLPDSNSNFDNRNRPPQTQQFATASALQQQQMNTQTGRVSNSQPEGKSQKGRDNRSQTSHSNKTRAYPSQRVIPPTPTSAYQSTAPASSQIAPPTSLNPSLQTTSGSSGNTTKSTMPLSQSPAKAIQGGGTNTSQTFQFHPISTSSANAQETFQLFPDFSGNRQHNIQHQVHDFPHENIMHNIQQQSQAPSAHFPSIHSQRSHPYYLPDITPSYDNFSVGSVGTTSTAQPPPTSASRQLPSSCSQQSSKFMYGSTTSTSSSSSAHNQPTATRPHNANTTNARLSQHSQQSSEQRLHPSIHQESVTMTSCGQHQSQVAVPHSMVQAHPTSRPTHRQGQTEHTQQMHRIQNQAQQPSQNTQNSTPSASVPSNKCKQLPSNPSTFQQSNQNMPHHLNQHHRQVQIQATQPSHLHSSGQQQHHGQPQQLTSTQQQQVPAPQHQQRLPPTQQQQHTSVGGQQQQQQQHSQRPQQHGRQQPSSSRTVNWMTDSAYRTGSSTNSNDKPQQQTATSNNPFSVSKLVGTSASSKTQPVASNTDGNTRDLIPPRSNANPNIGGRSNPTKLPGNSSSVTAGSSNPPAQSNYCAEALIRKNPPGWSDFNLGHAPSSTNHNFPDYSHSHSTIENADHFSSFSNLSGQYYPNTGHHVPVPPSPQHFGHFDSQSQHFHPPQHTPQHPNQQSTSYHTASVNQHHHNVHAHSHQNTHNMHYPYHQHHHQPHGPTSTSSVSNFNLSTIFPEINDKRSSSNNVNQGGGAVSAGNSNRAGGEPSGNMNSCYVHPGFGNASGNNATNLHQ